MLNNARHLEIRVMPYSDKQWLMVARDVRRCISWKRRNFRQRQHELRTPLTVLQGYLEMMQGRCWRATRKSPAHHAGSKLSVWKVW